MTVKEATKVIQEAIAQYGKVDTDVTVDGMRYFIVAPNRFGPGYIKVIRDGQIISSDFTTKRGFNTPKIRTAVQ